MTGNASSLYGLDSTSSSSAMGLAFSAPSPHEPGIKPLVIDRMGDDHHPHHTLQFQFIALTQQQGKGFIGDRKNGSVKAR
jgi:hypothetical protein